jgi:hypothetical protein
MGGSSGFSDLYIWGVVSFAFAAMSWRGIAEKRKKDERDRAAYLADLHAVAQQQRA